jgi:sterol-4alpha-carboxylate 3-dehydrogenase (decarboxylating)
MAETRVMMENDAALEKEHLVLTGGSGFLGGHILNALRFSFPGLKITVLDLTPSASFGDSVSFKHVDVSSASSVDSAFRALSTSPTIVIHTAGIVPTGNDRYFPSDETKARVWRTNVDGTQHVLDAARLTGAKNFIYTGSCTMITDDNSNNHINMNEESSPVGEALIYGKSKV